MYRKPTIAIVLDKRRENKKKLFPVKLRITFRVIENGARRWVQKYYGLRVNCSEADFNASQSKPKTDMQHKIRTTIQENERKAKKIIDDHTYMTEDTFTRLFTGESMSTVGDVFNIIMKELKENGQIGNYNFYRTTRNSIARFVNPDLEKLKTRKKEDDIVLNLSFDEVNEIWVKNYIAWLRKEKLSGTSIGIYLQVLRAVFNWAIKKHLVKADIYPFGELVIKRTKARKIALSEADKNRLLSVSDPELKYFVDFWTLSYYCYGLNMLDILSLRIRDIVNDVIIIERAKVKNTDNSGRQLIIPIRSEVKEIISRHGNKSLNPNDYVFPILKPDLTPTQIKNRVNDFTGKINSGLKKVMEKLKLEVNLTTYTARHTFSNIALLKGASKEFIQDALGHASMMTTENYLAGFDLETKKAISNKL